MYVWPSLTLDPFSHYKIDFCATRSIISSETGRTQMGFDNHLCDMGLLLGLGFTSTQDSESNTVNPFLKKPTFDHVEGDLEPSLTLGLFGETGRIGNQKIDMNKGCEEGEDLIRQASSQSALSSFSSDRVKREREHSSEEVEVEKFSSRVSDEDEDGSNARKKLRLTKDQSALLEDSFKLNSTLNTKQKHDLARQLNLRPRQVEVWFQNRRARTKLKQTEVDCEFLKKCCETLTDENRRLQKELQELKAVKMGQPLYMQMPAATLAICPSCERLNDGVSKTPFSMASKPAFFNLFTNPSAAC